MPQATRLAAACALLAAACGLPANLKMNGRHPSLSAAEMNGSGVLEPPVPAPAPDTGSEAALAAAAPTPGAESPATPAPPLKKLPASARVLVTGGAGFIGFHLARRLQSEGVAVTALDNFDPYYSVELKRKRWDLLRNAGVELVEGDLCNGSLLHALHARRDFTHVASLAGQAGVRYSLSNPQAYVRTNVQCFLALLEMLRNATAVKLVYASSSSVYGTNTKVPFAETDRVDEPASIYAVTKKTDEQMARTYHRLYNISVTGLRFFTVYGPWGRPDMAYFSMAHSIRHGEPIELYGHGTPQRDFTYVDDVVDGISAALALGAPEEIFNLGNHRVENVSRFVEALEISVGRKAIKRPVGMAKGDVPITYADVSHARALLGYEPKTSIDEGLRKFAEWLNSSDYRDSFAMTDSKRATSMFLAFEG